MERVDVGRGALAVEVAGPPDAPPLLVIAGGGGDRRSWDLVVDHLVADRRVARFDQAGVGDSVDVPMPMSGADYAADALAVGGAVLGERFSVVGMSLGGIAAQHLALEHPEAVLKLVLVSTVPGLSRFVGCPPDERPEDERSFSAGFVRREPERFRQAVAMGKRAAQCADSQSAQIDMFVNHDACDRLGSITVPTTVVCGTEDTTFPIGNSRLLAELIAGAHLVEIDGAGHALHYEVPDRLASIIRAATAA